MDSAQTAPKDQWDRRDLLKGILKVFMSGPKLGKTTSVKDQESDGLVAARALRKGDTVALVAPSSPLFEPGQLEFVYQWLDKLGLKYKLGKHLFDSYSDYAGSDEARLEDLHTLWADPEVRAILPVCGGNGSVRLLRHLDFDLIRKNPKILIGYSDLTGLLIPIHQETGLITFHGPMACSFYDSQYTYNSFVKALMQPKAIGLIEDPQPEKIWDPHYPPCRLVIAPGSAKGRLTGGCMTLIRQLMGTPYEIQTEGRIVFLEDLHEEPHAIDRILSQMLLAGKFEKCAGIIVGECSDCRPGDSNRRVLKLNYSLENVLQDRLGNLGIPVVYGLRIGHTDDRLTLPLGVMASLEVSHDKVVFSIDEKATN